MTRTFRLYAALLALVIAAAPWAARAACSLKYQEFAVTMTEMQPLVAAKVNGQSLRFVLDSGAFYSIITPGVAASLGLRLQSAPYGLTMEGAGGRFTPSIVKIKDFEIGPTVLHDVEFLTGGSESGGGTAGVLGQNFLHASDVEYDLANGVVRLVRPEGCGNAAMVYWDTAKPYSAVDRVTFDGDLFATTAWVEVNGRPLRGQFDTGSSVSFLTLAAARKLGFDPKAPGVVDAGLDYGFGPRPFRTWIMPVDSFKIGDEEVKHTRLRVGDSALGQMDMLIGADFFLSHHIYVANRRERIFFTYNGGPVFDLKVADAGPSVAPPAAPPPAAAAEPALFAVEPADADGYARRGAAFADRRDYARAVADLTKAHDMAPGVASHLYRRALVYLQEDKPALAMADLDAALKIAPDDADARMARASVTVEGPNRAGALADLQAADRLLAAQSDRRYDLAELYERASAWEEAARQFDLWIAAHPQDARRAQALNGRCWMGAMSGLRLNEALIACNAAVRMAPRTAAFLDSRGLVHLRRGETDLAIADYDAALALQPKLAWSLWGRGLARQRKGLTEAAKADFAAAAALQPKIADEARSRGIGP
jgi:tetratricopeptide (TPR) repeat protein/predicted aspartyl protease